MKGYSDILFPDFVITVLWQVFKGLYNLEAVQFSLWPAARA